MKTFTENIIVEDENSDIIHLWEPLDFNINDEYKYIQNGIFFSICSFLLYYGIAFPVLKIVTKILYDFKIEGKENIRNLKEGAISVSNHVLFLDCAMVGLASGFKKIYFTTREGSFKIPFVRKLIKLLRAIPIPKSASNKRNFIKEIDEALQKGNIVHFYPESALWTYCEKIRNFKESAFNFAINNDVPVIPMVFKFRKPKGIRKIFKRKKDVTLVILEPIKIKHNNINKKICIEELKQKVYEQMKQVI